MLTAPDPSLTKWIADNIHLVGWPALLGLVWTFRGALDKFLRKNAANIQKLDETHTTILSTSKTVTEIRDNHLKHLEEAIVELKKNGDEQLKCLQSIDKGVAVLAAKVK